MKETKKAGSFLSSFFTRERNLFFAISLLVVFFDQLSKFFISANMAINQTIPVIRGIFHITCIKNTGAGFGLLKDMNYLLLAVSILVIFAILFNLSRLLKEKKTLIPFSLILGGAVGNAIDRILLGNVIDFLDFRVWPVFNIADSSITIGAVLLVFYYWKK